MCNLFGVCKLSRCIAVYILVEKTKVQDGSGRMCRNSKDIGVILPVVLFGNS